MRRFWPVGFALMLNFAGASHAADPRCASRMDHFQLKGGVIGDEKTAAAVALAYLVPIYGEAAMRREIPLRGKLSDGIWTVSGTLPHGSIGGAAQILICQRNGAVLSIIHYK